MMKKKLYKPRLTIE